MAEENLLRQDLMELKTAVNELATNVKLQTQGMANLEKLYDLRLQSLEADLKAQRDASTALQRVTDAHEKDLSSVIHKQGTASKVQDMQAGTLAEYNGRLTALEKTSITAHVLWAVALGVVSIGGFLLGIILPHYWQP